jgi:predicted ArsR family transcriptional regulator
MLTGLRLLGVDDDDAWRVTVKVALDSMPATRLQVLDLLLDQYEAVPTTTVAAALGLPSSTTRRVLEDLAAHGAVARISQGKGKTDLWNVTDWAASLYRGATVPEKSEDPF